MLPCTEGIGGCVNICGKVRAVGYLPISMPLPQRTFLVRQIPETGEYVRDDRGFLVKAGVNEPGELIAAIDNNDPIFRYDGYENQKATNKKMMRDVFKKGDLFFKSGDILRMDDEGRHFSLEGRKRLHDRGGGNHAEDTRSEGHCCLRCPGSRHGGPGWNGDAGI